MIRAHQQIERGTIGHEGIAQRTAGKEWSNSGETAEKDVRKAGATWQAGWAGRRPRSPRGAPRGESRWLYISCPSPNLSHNVGWDELRDGGHIVRKD